MDYDQLRLYLARFGDFLTKDGRQDFWIRGEKGMVVYDKHETLYLYGPLEVFETTLLEMGFSNSDFEIDFPHYHQYHEEFDEDELAITESEDYIFSELQEVDVD